MPVVSRRARLECLLNRSLTLDPNRYIVLKFLQEFQEACFLGITLKLLLDTPSVSKGHTKNQTRVPFQEVRNS